MIRYIVDLSIRTEYPPNLATASYLYDADADLFEIEIGEHPTSSYWINWGGFYDTPIPQNAEIFFSSFLRKVSSEAELVSTPGTMLLGANRILIHLSRKPWQFLSSMSEYNEVQGYASAPRNEDEPSDHFIPDALGVGVYYPVRLMIPTVPNRLSDPISGTTLLPTFSVDLENSDGNFDDTEELNILNTPLTLRRSDTDNPTLSDFKVIRYGLVDSVSVTKSQYTITAADTNRTLTEPALRKFSTSIFPDLPESNEDKPIPILYGTQTVPLFEVGTDEYIAIDPQYVSGVSEVFDRDGSSISFTYSSATGIITATDAITATVKGRTNNRIGEIITTEIEEKAGIAYLDGPWDKEETDSYIAISAHVNFYYDRGDVRSLVNAVLKNDNAFLFTKNDSRLTLRQWAEEYTEHIIPSWQIMELPSKDNAEGKRYYMSSSIIQWDKNIETGNYGREFFNDDREAELSERYRRKKTETFPTDLYQSSEIQDLSTRLINRFGIISELIRVKIASPATNINPLDTVILDMVINGRTMTRLNGWIVREVDPAQDTLLLEGYGLFDINDMILGRYDADKMILGTVETDMVLGIYYRARLQ